MNGNENTTAPDHTARIARLTWLFTFVIPLILAGLLLGVKSAQAAPPFPGLVPLALEEELAFEDEFELEEEAEFAEEECEIAEEELEEGETSEAQAERICEEAEDAAGHSSTAAEGCPLRSAHAHVARQHGRLKLTLGYTTNVPTKVTIQIRAGSTRIDSVKRHLGKSGVLRFTKKLGKKTNGRVVIRIKLPPTERAGCPSRRLVLFPG